MNEQLLLVEDDEAIAGLMQQHLEQAGFQVRHCADGTLAQRALAANRFDLVLLDLGLPGVDGWALCRQVRERGRLEAATGYVPMIIVSARGTEAHRVLGLELGADDYLCKPFSMLELVARVRALLRRVDLLRSGAPGTAPLRLGGWWLDAQRRELRRDAQAVALTLREYDLMHFLATHPGQTFSRSDLLNRVWGDGFDGYEHTVNSHINRLRSKLAPDTQAAAMIETVWGVGYRFASCNGDTPRPALPGAE